MTYKGTVRDGGVVLESVADLPEGAAVRIFLEPHSESSGESKSDGRFGVWQALESLPADAGIEDFVERLLLFHKIERGVRQLDAGQGIPHEEARKRFSEWLD